MYRYLFLIFLTVMFYPALAMPQNDDMEVIEVKGQRSIFFLEKSIEKSRVAFYDLFNSVNENKKFDIICRFEKPLGSNIAERVCEPRYFKELRAQLIQERAVSGTKINMSLIPSDDDVLAASKKDREASLIHMQELLLSNPELQAAYLELHDMVERYNTRKESTN
jgi:hypothetical protein